MRKLATKRSEVLFLVQDPDAVRRIRRRGGSSQSGPLDSETTYQKAHLERVDQVILFVRDTELWERVYTQIRSLRPDTSILSLASGKKSIGGHKDKLLSQLPLEDIFEEFCAPQLLDTVNRRRVEIIRSRASIWSSTIIRSGRRSAPASPISAPTTAQPRRSSPIISAPPAWSRRSGSRPRCSTASTPTRSFSSAAAI